MKEIEKFLEEFPNKTIGNEKINDLLSYKKNSIWWFYKNRLEGDHLPNPLPKMEEIKNNKKTSKTKIFAMKKAFGINEKLKIHFSKKQKINFNTNKKILCLIPTIRKKGNYIDRIDKILKEIDKKEDTNYKIEFFEAQSKLTKLEKNNLFYRHLTKDIIKKSNSEAKKLNKQWNKIKKEIT
ncbi:hypothetical protein HN865_03850, partial [Candidatus Woesearchaeota archaeon]|nr:hypothetical protein [Candidatus Woesearchaeota archaeon]